MNFLEGFGIGLAMVVFIGPVFFTLIQSSLQFGKLSGLMVALGIIVSDIVCVLIYYLGLNTIDFSPDALKYTAAAGSILLFGMGVKYIIQKPPSNNVQLNIKLNLLSSFTKGFAVNFINPFVFLVWAGVYVFAYEKYTGEFGLELHLIGVLLGILLTDILKVLISSKLNHYLQSKYLARASKAFGVIMIGFALRLILYLFKL